MDCPFSNKTISKAHVEFGGRVIKDLGMRLSVIIPVRDGARLLPQCLQAITRSSEPADEVLVLDDSSEDDSAAIAVAHGARVIQIVGGSRGPAFARNRGAKAAIGDLLLFIDADVEVHADTLARIRSTFEREPELEALFGSYDDRPAASGTASRFKNLLHHYVHQHGRREASTFWTGCGAIRRETFLRAGGFDEYYTSPSIEDIELGLRLHRANVPIHLCPEIQVTHLKRWNLYDLWRTDVFSRALPWSRIILQQHGLRSDLNLTWRDRLGAAAAWTGLFMLLLSVAMVQTGHLETATWSACAAGSALLIGSVLNAELYLFFFRHGGATFAVAAWSLHLAYLLYSSAAFGILALVEFWRIGLMRRPVSK